VIGEHGTRSKAVMKPRRSIRLRPEAVGSAGRSWVGAIKAAGWVSHLVGQRTPTWPGRNTGSPRFLRWTAGEQALQFARETGLAPYGKSSRWPHCRWLVVRGLGGIVRGAATRGDVAVGGGAFQADGPPGRRARGEQLHWPFSPAGKQGGAQAYSPAHHV